MFKQMIGLMKQRKYIYIMGLIGGMTGQISFIIISAFVKKTIINAAFNGQINVLLNSALIILLVIILGCIFDPIARYISNRCIKKTMMELRNHLFSHLAKLPLTYFDNTHSGEIMSRINNDLSAMERAYGWQMHMLLLSIIAGSGSLVSMFILDWRLTSLVIVFGLTSVWVNTSFASALKKISERIQRENSKLLQALENILAGLRTIKMFNLGVIMTQYFLKKNETLLEAQMLLTKKNSLMNGLNFFFNNLNLLGILFIGSLMVANGSIDFGTVLAIISLQTGLDFLLYQFSNYLVQYQQALAGAKRVFELLDQSIEPKIFLPTKSSYKKSSSYEKEMILLEDVCFGYQDKPRILKKLNLKIKQGEHVAIVGSSGAGKSTIFKILLGYYPISSGHIVLQGRSFSDYSLEEMRNLIAYIPQDVYLFSGTIEENLCYGEPNLSREEIKTVAQATYADEFIRKLPKKYQTQIMRMGSSLSGGQKQRIAVTRALLKDAPIVFFDEATSALDSESESQLQRRLTELIRGKTVVTIAHRLATIANADRIFVLEAGRVVEKGKHHELLKLGGLYQQFYYQQTFC